MLALLRANFEAMVVGGGDPELRYDVHVEPRPVGPEPPGGPRGAIRLARRDSHFEGLARDVGELIYRLESDLVIQAQLRRPELLFLHAAALELEGRAYLLVGRSGAGKSTTCWGLLRHGFRYLSDELAPVALDSTVVLGYPHALCLKRNPPPGYPVPDTTMRTPRGLHIPINGSSLYAGDEAPPVAAIFFVEYDPSTRRPAARGITVAETTARLYPQILNALAHEGDGLTAAASVASAVPGYRLESAELGATCRAVRACIDEAVH